MKKKIASALHDFCHQRYSRTVIAIGIAWTSTTAAPVNANSYTVDVNASQVEGYSSQNLFGANLVYHKNNLDAAYKQTFSALGMRSIRYPGGTIAETDFDYLDSNGPGDDRPSLNDVLNYCSTNSLTPFLVIPTKRFKNNIQAGASYAKDFVQAVNQSDTFGNLDVLHWEIGNEYYASDGLPSISASKYGTIANAMNQSMLDHDDRINPTVQFYRHNITDAGIIAGKIDGQAKAILTHVYPDTSDAQIDAVAGQLISARSAFGSDELYVTEWNISSGSSSRSMMHASYLVQIFSAMVDGGVKRAHVWPLLWKSNGVATVLASETGSLRPAGSLLQWLSAYASNTSKVEAAASDPAIKSFAFKKAGELTIFVLARDAPLNSSLKLKINNFSFSQVAAQRMWAHDPMSLSTPSVSTVTPARNSAQLAITINKYSKWEIIRITLKP